MRSAAPADSLQSSASDDTQKVLGGQHVIEDQEKYKDSYQGSSSADSSERASQSTYDSTDEHALLAAEGSDPGTPVVDVHTDSQSTFADTDTSKYSTNFNAYVTDHASATDSGKTDDQTWQVSVGDDSEQATDVNTTGGAFSDSNDSAETFNRAGGDDTSSPFNTFGTETNQSSKNGTFQAQSFTGSGIEPISIDNSLVTTNYQNDQQVMALTTQQSQAGAAYGGLADDSVWNYDDSGTVVSDSSERQIGDAAATSTQSTDRTGDFQESTDKISLQYSGATKTDPNGGGPYSASDSTWSRTSLSQDDSSVTGHYADYNSVVNTGGNETTLNVDDDSGQYAGKVWQYGGFNMSSGQQSSLFGVTSHHSSSSDSSDQVDGSGTYSASSVQGPGGQTTNDSHFTSDSSQAKVWGGDSDTSNSSPGGHSESTVTHGGKITIQVNSTSVDGQMTAHSTHGNSDSHMYYVGTGGPPSWQNSSSNEYSAESSDNVPGSQSGEGTDHFYSNTGPEVVDVTSTLPVYGLSAGSPSLGIDNAAALNEDQHVALGVVPTGPPNGQALGQFPPTAVPDTVWLTEDASAETAGETAVTDNLPEYKGTDTVQNFENDRAVLAGASTTGVGTPQSLAGEYPGAAPGVQGWSDPATPRGVAADQDAAAPSNVDGEGNSGIEQSAGKQASLAAQLQEEAEVRGFWGVVKDFAESNPDLWVEYASKEGMNTVQAKLVPALENGWTIQVASMPDGKPGYRLGLSDGNLTITLDSNPDGAATPDIQAQFQSLQNALEDPRIANSYVDNESGDFAVPAFDGRHGEVYLQNYENADRSRNMIAVIGAPNAKTASDVVALGDLAGSILDRIHLLEDQRTELRQSIPPGSKYDHSNTEARIAANQTAQQDLEKQFSSVQKEYESLGFDKYSISAQVRFVDGNAPGPQSYGDGLFAAIRAVRAVANPPVERGVEPTGDEVDIVMGGMLAKQLVSAGVRATYSTVKGTVRSILLKEAAESFASNNIRRTIAQLVEATGSVIADDAIVNFGSTARALVNPPIGGRSYWFRYGDIKHFTEEGLKSVFGQMAAAAEPGGASVIRVSELPATAFRKTPPTSMSGISEFVIDTSVPVKESVRIVD